MKIALFGGSFDPIHREHIRLAQEAQRILGLDKLIFIPSFRAPHKSTGAVAEGEDRLRLCRIACNGMPFAEASGYELEAGGTSYTYLTCRAFREKYPSAELFFLVGADMLEDFFSWRCPEEILKCVTLVACGREKAIDPALCARFRERFHTDVVCLPWTGEAVSSSDVRVSLAFGDRERAERLLSQDVLGEIEARGLYRYPLQEGALGLLTPVRRAHSERVARMAVKRARSLKIPERKALIASMLHDCGKYVTADSPLLKGFVPPEDVPPPVLHQFTGAFIAETSFAVTEEDILDAIRYHTSGRPEMTALGKLVYLADLLEEGRDFEGIGRLRALFYEDLDACLCAALERQLAYLNEQGQPVYPLTAATYQWIKTQHISRF